MKIEDLTTATFHEKVANMDADPQIWDYLGDKPCIVIFYTAWCSPCSSLMKRLEELSIVYNDQFYIYKVNVEKEKRLAVNFNVRTVPFLLFCPQTQEPESLLGFKDKSELKNMINRVLLKDPKSYVEEDEE